MDNCGYFIPSNSPAINGMICLECRMIVNDLRILEIGKEKACKEVYNSCVMNRAIGAMHRAKASNNSHPFVGWQAMRSKR